MLSYSLSGPSVIDPPFLAIGVFPSVASKGLALPTPRSRLSYPVTGTLFTLLRITSSILCQGFTLSIPCFRRSCLATVSFYCVFSSVYVCVRFQCRFVLACSKLHKVVSLRTPLVGALFSVKLADFASITEGHSK